MIGAGWEKSTWIVILLIAINLVISAGVMIAGAFRPKGKRATTILHGLFYLVCPVVGPTAFLLNWILNLILRSKRFDSESLTFSTERTKAVLLPDERAEMNYIPILDALEMDETSQLRQLMMNLLKNKSLLDMKNMTRAIASDDVETSHYAATSLTNFLSQFRSTARAKILRIEQIPDDVPTLLEAIEFFRMVLEAHIMDDIEQKSYVYTQENLNERLFEQNRWYLKSEHYLSLVDLLIDIKDFPNALKWSKRAEECRPNELDTYKAMLHVQYAMGNQRDIFETLEELKNSDVFVDQETLDLIRILDGRE